MREPKVSLVRLQPVLEILQAVLWTGRLVGESPVSCCLVAESQSAKSQCLLYYSETKTLKVFTDITSKGMFAEMRDIETRKLRHIVLLDLHMIVSHNRYTTDRALLTLGGLMEEGIASVSDAGGIMSFDGIPKIGVIMATTPDFFLSRRGHWRKTGFLTRFITINYSYSPKTHRQIHEAIRDGLMLPDPSNIALPEESMPVIIKPAHADIIMRQANLWATGAEDPGFRYHKQLRRLLMASALSRGRNVTAMQDVENLLTWMKFMNQAEPVEL